MVFLLSDFLHSPFSDQLLMGARRFDLAAMRLVDPREQQIPAVGRVRLRDLETSEQLVLNTSDPSFQKEQSVRFESVSRSLQEGFRSAGIDFAEFSTAEAIGGNLIRFLRGRSKGRRRFGRSA